jgi:hypothetical protein
VKTTKTPKLALQIKKKIKRSAKRPNLAERYDEVKWLRGLVEYFEGKDRKRPQK